jgi:hypothetical protein
VSEKQKRGCSDVIFIVGFIILAVYLYGTVGK